ncbi:MAG: hypothetical protein M0036_03480 [Desulfobacteraceae bacterium]|nr:hypothetical protein [Desulfobacteraceae bacterium]
MGDEDKKANERAVKKSQNGNGQCQPTEKGKNETNAKKSFFLASSQFLSRHGAKILSWISEGLEDRFWPGLEGNNTPISTSRFA